MADKLIATQSALIPRGLSRTHIGKYRRAGKRPDYQSLNL